MGGRWGTTIVRAYPLSTVGHTTSTVLGSVSAWCGPANRARRPRGERRESDRDETTVGARARQEASEKEAVVDGGGWSRGGTRWTEHG